MINAEQIPFPLEAQQLNTSSAGGNGLFAFSSPYMTTDEAAVHMKVSKSYLLRQPDIPFLKGKPNIYKRSDLDAWFEQRKFKPELHENIESIETVNIAETNETDTSKSI